MVSAPAAPAYTPITPEVAGMPLYRAVKRALLAAIESGVQAPGSTLPNEAALAQALGVSMGTLRHAVGELVGEHILVRHQGRGTFVATHHADRFLFQFFHVERSDGLRESPQVELLTFAATRLDEDAATALRRPVGDLGWQLENRLLLQGRPVVRDLIQLSAARFPQLSEAMLRERPGTIYQLYQASFGITVLRAVERARAIAADHRTASVLGLPARAPVLQVRRTALSFGDTPVEYRVSSLHTAAHDYVQTLSRPS